MTYKKLISAVALVFIFFSVNYTYAAPTLGPSTIAPAVYAQLVSKSDHMATTDNLNKGIPISLQTIDSISGMEWDTVNNRLIVKLAGVYVISSNAQVGTRIRNQDANQLEQVFYWIEHNGSPIFDSGNTVFVNPQLRSKTVSNNWIVPLDEGDNLQFMFSSTAAGMGLTGISANKNIAGYPDAFTPNSPSFTVTIYKLTDLAPVSMGPKALMPPAESPPPAQPIVYPPAITHDAKLVPEKSE